MTVDGCGEGAVVAMAVFRAHTVSDESYAQWNEQQGRQECDETDLAAMKPRAKLITSSLEMGRIIILPHPVEGNIWKK